MGLQLSLPRFLLPQARSQLFQPQFLGMLGTSSPPCSDPCQIQDLPDFCPVRTVRVLSQPASKRAQSRMGTWKLGQEVAGFSQALIQGYSPGPLRLGAWTNQASCLYPVTFLSSCGVLLLVEPHRLKENQPWVVEAGRALGESPR